MPENKTRENEARALLLTFAGNDTPPEETIVINESGEPQETDTDTHDPLEEYHMYPMGTGLYITKEPLDEDALKAGIIFPTGGTPPEAMHPSQPAPRGPRTPRMNMWLMATILLACVLVAENIMPLYTLISAAFYHKPAQIVLFAASQPFTKAYTYLAVTGTVAESQQQIAARLLSTTTDTQSLTIQTTGIAHTPPVQAQGTLTFYNAAPYDQTIDVGTVITGADGIQVVTDESITITAGNPPSSYGISQPVPSHTLQAGAQSNIQHLDINGLTGIAGISVKNTTTFSGGRNPLSYPTVSQKDVDSTTTQLLPLLYQQGEESITREIQPNERTLQKTTCTPQATSIPAVGVKATRVTIAVQARCTAQVYDYHGLVIHTTTSFLQDVQAQLGTEYMPVAPTSITLAHIKELDSRQHTYSVVATVSGSFALSLSQKQQHQLAVRLTGKSLPVARQMLLQIAGIQRADITLPTQDDTTLPSDPGQIVFILAET